MSGPGAGFFRLHSDLPREGPGEAEDVLWALETAGVPERAVIADAGCGPGADTLTLAEARLFAEIDAVDLHAPFVAQTAARCERYGRRVRAMARDYLDLPGDYDFIWCAGAAYFAGYLAALAAWRERLLPGGRIAFSEPAWVSDPPSEAARAFWAGEAEVRQPAETEAALADAGWQVLGRRFVIGASWAGYYGPLAARAAALKAADPDPETAEAIAETEAEIARWRSAPDQVAYALFVVAPA